MNTNDFALQSGFKDVVSILLNFIEKGFYRVEQISEATFTALEAAIKGDKNKFHAEEKVVEDLISISKTLYAQDPYPYTVEDFVRCGLDDSVARKLMQDVFGSTEIVIGLNIRKVVVAIDLIDWEGINGVERRSEMKSKDVTPAYVKRSILTWLPAGTGMPFQDAVERIGAAIGKNTVGFWGKMQTVINKHFKPSEKEVLNSMADAILRYYKASKCGARKQFNL